MRQPFKAVALPCDQRCDNILRVKLLEKTASGQSHRIVRFLDRTIGCDLANVRPIGNVCYDLRLSANCDRSCLLVVGHRTIGRTLGRANTSGDEVCDSRSKQWRSFVINVVIISPALTPRKDSEWTVPPMCSPEHAWTPFPSPAFPHFSDATPTKRS